MEDRRTLIADSAIEVVAREGVRALTHRAVDAEAGLSAGSSSYYCRSRAQLLALTVERLVALLRGFVEVSGVQEARPNEHGDVVALLTEMEHGLLADYRAELTARWALVVELSGSDDTTELVAALLDPSDLTGALASAGIKHTDETALELLSVFEGLLWERTLGRLAGTDPEPGRDASMLDAVLSRHVHRTGRGLIGRLR